MSSINSHKSSETEKHTLPVSIIIPTLNEEKYLGDLLESIKEQSYQPREIIVADAFSTDRTREIAEFYGAKVIDGGELTVGRNNGAEASKEDLLFFMDADTICPHKYFLKRTYDLFIESEANIASTFIRLRNEPENNIVTRIFMSSYFLLKILSSKMRKPIVETGCFLLAKKDSFQKLGGFTTLKSGIAEDLDIMLRAIESGLRYKVLPCRIAASGRRYRKVIPSLRTLLGAILSGIIVKYKLYDNKNAVNIATGLYGELGGQDEESKAVTKKRDLQKEELLYTDSRLRKKITQIKQTATGIAISAAVILFILSRSSKRKNSSSTKTLAKKRKKR
ncbi:MAG TPA: glycosyltransferase [bacterium]|nr:glycosyltransferase [bacterium]